MLLPGTAGHRPSAHDPPSATRRGGIGNRLMAPRPDWSLESLLRGQPRRVLLLTGPSLVLDLGTALAARAALAGHGVLYLDAANAFDPYIPACLAREAGLNPRPVLDRLFIS